MQSSLCDDWADYECFSSLGACESFMYGILKDGYYNTMMEFVFLTSEFLTRSNFHDAHASFSSTEWRIMSDVVEFIVHKKNEKYVDLLVDSVENITQNTHIIILIVTLVFILIAAICFLLLWLPYVLRLKEEACRTNSMLLLIPTDVYMTNKYLRGAFERKVVAFIQNR
eukprot:TRINITY_DN9551_c0_g1_i1.p2 TRINITY_DN9551_c0_g1~~TRINITY_DN9551_c0_g1_i1.p2  ORF type:complete len:169 (-),score=29.88 TRINITY_DN9551_c0_g1_i1:92-598(-)